MRLSIINGIVAESLSNDYVISQDAKKLMADFYTLEYLLSQPLPVGERSEHLKFYLDNARQQLVTELKSILLYKAGYSILSELYHYRFRSDITIDDFVKLGVNEKIIISLATRPKDSFLLKQLPKYRNRPIFYKVIKAAVVLFGDFEWQPMYGGEAWAKCCEAWINLYNASNLNDISRCIDIIYSIQHNSSGLLDKNEDYEGRWLKEMLDLKFDTQDVESIAGFASNYVKQLAKAFLGVSRQVWDQDKADNSLENKIVRFIKCSLGSQYVVKIKDLRKISNHLKFNIRILNSRGKTIGIVFISGSDWETNVRYSYAYIEAKNLGLSQDSPYDEVASKFDEYQSEIYGEGIDWGYVRIDIDGFVSANKQITFNNGDRAMSIHDDVLEMLNEILHFTASPVN